MRCPRCEEGMLEKMQLKKSGEKGFVCDVCEAFWLDNEDTGTSPGHPLSSLKTGDDFEYTIDRLSAKSSEYQPVSIQTEGR